MRYVPIFDREYFDQCLILATKFAVWVQISPALQKLVPISREEAIEIANEGLKFGPIWGQFSDNCIELSLTSQWLNQLDI